MPALDDLDHERRQRVLEIRTKVRDVVAATNVADPEIREAIRFLAVQTLSLTARAEYAEQHLEDIEGQLRTLVNGLP